MSVFDGQVAADRLDAGQGRVANRFGRLIVAEGGDEQRQGFAVFHRSECQRQVAAEVDVLLLHKPFAEGGQERLVAGLLDRLDGRRRGGRGRRRSMPHGSRPARSASLPTRRPSREACRHSGRVPHHLPSHGLRLRWTVERYRRAFARSSDGCPTVGGELGEGLGGVDVVDEFERHQDAVADLGVVGGGKFLGDARPSR